jgi:hypothetical protein
MAATHHQERDMWQRYSSNILVPNEYTEECWLGVHSDASLQWLFGPEFITAQLSPHAQTPLMKRVKEIFRLRRLLAEKLIAAQQQYIRPILNNTNREQPPSLTRLRLTGNTLRRYLPHTGARRHQHMHTPGQEVRASTAMWIKATSPGPPPQLDAPQRKKRKRYRHTPITKCFAPCGQPCPSLPLRHPKQSKARYLTRTYGSANIKDPPETK